MTSKISSFFFKFSVTLSLTPC